MCAYLGLLFVVFVCVGVTCFTWGYFVYFMQWGVPGVLGAPAKLG